MRYELTAVAFIQSVGGEIGVLLAVDRDGEQLFDGEPALLMRHRPGADHGALHLEGAEVVPVELVEELRAGAADLAGLVEGAHARDGMFDGGRLVGGVVVVEISNDSM
ncbi:MAG: hypothetical protein JWM25_1812 [Thermoleophilia bacterium]|nr:hypothetical protein [Thermoleophilia bacterium]MCZ4497227.1 hypothetical protein [Thermoleophilia bacterium]